MAEFFTIIGGILFFLLIIGILTVLITVHESICDQCPYCKECLKHRKDRNYMPPCYHYNNPYNNDLNHLL